jgi:hypothetical protein
MLGIPEEYKVDKQIDIKTFLTSDLKPNEKKRLRDVVLEINLESQVAGESIPSLINNHYDCQVIMYVGVRLKSLKAASFVGDTIQRLVKSLCVVRCIDPRGMEVYVFAHKRLNLQDRTEVVIEDHFITVPASIQFSDEVSAAIQEFAFFKRLKNKENKLSMYLELMTKSYIASNLSLWTGGVDLLSSKAWYNVEDVLKILKVYMRLTQVKKEQKYAKTVAEQANYNFQLKKLYLELTTIME